MDTRIRHLCETNTVPTKEEEMILRHTLEQDTRTGAHLEMRIRKLQATLENLLLQHTDLRARITAQKGALSAVRRIPPEIIAEIFLYCRSNLETRVFPLSFLESPVPLSHICSTWRKVALGLPRLWTDVSLDYISSYPPTSILDMGHVWFSRTSALPLSIALNRIRPLDVESGTDIIAQYANRFRKIKIVATRDSILSFVGSLPSTVAALEYVSVRNCTFPSIEGWGSWPRFSMPNLRKVSLSGFTYLSFQEVTRGLPWAQLTHLDLSNHLPFQVCHDLLRQCNKITECSLSILGDDNNNPSLEAHTPEILLAQLKALYISGDYGSSVTSLLRPLVIPSLSMLVFNGRALDISIDTFAALASRSSFTLKKYTDVSRGNDPSMLLDLMPSLRQLELVCSSFDRVLHRFNNYELLSKLQHLTLREVDDRGTDVVLSLIHSRWWPGSVASKVYNGVVVPRLEHLSFALLECKWKHIPGRILEHVDRLRQEGLEISLCHSYESTTPAWLSS